MDLSRRDFMKTTGTAATLGLTGSIAQATGSHHPMPGKGIKAVTIADVDSNFEREPLIRPFGFKGGYMSEIWQTLAMVKSASGAEKVGLCTQSVLWSDASVFAGHSEAAGNAIMYSISERALQICKGRSFETPIELLEEILEEVYV